MECYVSDQKTLDYWEKYLDYAEWKREQLITRQERRRPKRKKAVAYGQKEELLADLAETLQLESDFDFTYTPSQHEAGWMLKALKQFYQEELITDVLAQVKGGKEASVYQCRAHPTTGKQYVAAKVYRPRMFRNLRNDAMYREGRKTRALNGGQLSPLDHRAHKAIAQKSAFGIQLKHESWMAHEYEALRLLFDDGAAVPEPIRISQNAILMDYIGDEHGAAPILHSVDLREWHDTAVIRTLFEQAINAIEQLLIHKLVHGDLSPYNILYWQSRLYIIDLPQVTAIDSPHARHILQRDIERVCAYFKKQGVRSRPDAIAAAFWQQYNIPYE